PLSPEVNQSFGQTLVSARRYDQAIERLHNVLNLAPDYWWAHAGMGRAYIQKGNLTKAIAETNNARLIENDIADPLLCLGYAYAMSGRKDEARKLIDELKERLRRSYVCPYFIAMIYAGLGEKDQAFAWLGKAYEDRTLLMVFLNVDPEFDSLRSDPRFAELLQRVNFPQYFGASLFE